ncbi:hypothetical protein L9F63_021138 [Diploptera punctata]|uniref:S-adenosylmethionine sensor upstream of mTORC1 n=1 Tax=Diploptera punctata TaxID=6984 RepID=A0AAD7ZRI5_DIPPU|nr:hypothetical protein L9F63_021138 [Diploptera punctata]
MGQHEIPVLETRKVLSKHLHAKILPHCQSSGLANTITSRIAEKFSDKEIISLLENDSALAEIVNSLMSNASVIKQALGERLFVAVAKLNSELCAQITGMLLELDVETLESLLTNSTKLEAAGVCMDDCKLPEKPEDLGEVVYKSVLQHHPDPKLAAQLTGMLLELDFNQLQNLTQNSEQLKAKVTMATEEQQKLSSFVKNVHQALRLRAQKIGADEAWKEHCSDETTLREYAVAMERLASKFWKENAKDENKSAQCRIEWVVEKCLHYFFGEQLINCRIKEKERMKKLKEEDINNEFVEGNKNECLKLLDVGSCYNPFKNYPFLHVIPIDISPATSDVHFCDFLSLNIIDSDEKSDILEKLSSQTPIVELPSNSFDVVVFSLLLEYLPSPKQRYLCISKAYKLLKPEGILFIITPDSKHASANAPIMKSWRIMLAQMGFTRVYYEKLPHVHCMAFRKGIYPQVSQHWASIELTKQKCDIFMDEMCCTSLKILIKLCRRMRVNL